jgi:glycosyltransferase involved in cell wall biosynthesis
MTVKNRVLWLTPDKPDNISVGRERIADHLESREFDVTLRGTTPRTVLQTLREAGEYDAIIGTTRAGALAGALLKVIYRSPFIVDHIDPIRQFSQTNPQWIATVVRVLENITFRLANYVLYVYEEERQRVARYAGNVAATDLGVEFDRFANPDPESIKSAQRKFSRLDVKENVAIYVGGLEPIYNIESMIAAIDRLPEWSLVVIGDGSLQETVATAANEMSNIHYFGTVPHEEVPGYLHVSDVGLSLVDDPHTLKVLEYGAAGLAVVQTAGRAEDRFGDLVEYCESDPVSIAGAIEDAVANSEFQSFVSEFDWARIADDYQEVLTRVM